jgi:hypothetical protein
VFASAYVVAECIDIFRRPHRQPQL